MWFVLWSHVVCMDTYITEYSQYMIMQKLGSIKEALYVLEVVQKIEADEATSSMMRALSVYYEHFF